MQRANDAMICNDKQAKYCHVTVTLFVDQSNFARYFTRDLIGQLANRWSIRTYLHIHQYLDYTVLCKTQKYQFNIGLKCFENCCQEEDEYKRTLRTVYSQWQRYYSKKNCLQKTSTIAV